MQATSLDLDLARSFFQGIRLHISGAPPRRISYHTRSFASLFDSSMQSWRLCFFLFIGSEHLQGVTGGFMTLRPSFRFVEGRMQGRGLQVHTYIIITCQEWRLWGIVEDGTREKGLFWAIFGLDQGIVLLRWYMEAQ